MLAQLTHYKNYEGSIGNLAELIKGKSLKNYLQLFLLSCKVTGLSPRSLDFYRDKINRFIRFVGEVNIEEIEASHIRLFLLKLQETNCPMSIHDYYRGIRRFFNWLIEEEYLERSPMRNLKPPRVPRKIIKPFTAEHICKMLSLCDDRKFLGARNKAMILMLLDTGLRLGEFISLDIKDIDIEKETIKVMGKGARERLVRIGIKTQKALLRYLLMRDDNYPCLWVSEERIPLKSGGVADMIKDVAKRAGIDKEVRCSPHTFRHTFAINFLRNGAGEFVTQMTLGHSSLDMTRRYVSSLGTEDMLNTHKRASPVDNMRLK